MTFRDRPEGRRAPASEPDWLTLGQAAKYLGVAQSTIRKWSDQGRVPAFYTPGGHRRYRRGERGAASSGQRARHPAERHHRRMLEQNHGVRPLARLHLGRELPLELPCVQIRRHAELDVGNQPEVTADVRGAEAEVESLARA